MNYLFVIERVLWEIKEDGVDDGWRRGCSWEIESCRVNNEFKDMCLYCMFNCMEFILL